MEQESKGLKLVQHRLVNSHKSGNGQNTLLMLEHSPTYTVGKRGAIYDESFEGKKSII